MKNIEAIYIYIGYTKVTIDYWNIRPLVTITFIGYYLKNNWIDFHDQTCIVKYSSKYF